MQAITTLANLSRLTGGLKVLQSYLARYGSNGGQLLKRIVSMSEAEVEQLLTRLQTARTAQAADDILNSLAK